MKKIYITFALLFAPMLNAQKSDLGNWWIYFGNVQLNEEWNWHHEVQYRAYDFAEDTEQLLLRTGIGYTIPQTGLNLLMGYGYIGSQNYSADGLNRSTVEEHRIFQQIISKQQFKRLFVTHRYRFEQRFVEEDFRMRFRYFLSLNLPLNKIKVEPGAFYLSAYNEIFIGNEEPFYDRNRLYGGVGYRFNPMLRTEVGYMNQYFTGRDRDQINLILFLSI